MICGLGVWGDCVGWWVWCFFCWLLGLGGGDWDCFCVLVVGCVCWGFCWLESWRLCWIVGLLVDVCFGWSFDLLFVLDKLDG